MPTRLGNNGSRSPTQPRSDDARGCNGGKRPELEHLQAQDHVEVSRVALGPRVPWSHRLAPGPSHRHLRADRITPHPLATLPRRPPSTCPLRARPCPRWGKRTPPSGCSVYSRAHARPARIPAGISSALSSVVLEEPFLGTFTAGDCPTISQ